MKQEDHTLEQEYPFRPRGRHGFDRDDVINYISQAKLQCQEHLARLEEMETAKAAWYTQAKGLESEKATLAGRIRELEDQLSRSVNAAPAPAPEPPDWLNQDRGFDQQEFKALKARCIELDQLLMAEKETVAALQVEKAQWEDREERGEAAQADSEELNALREQLAQQEAAAQAWMHRVASLEQENAELESRVRVASESQGAQEAALQAAKASDRAAFEARAQALADASKSEIAALANQLNAMDAERADLAGRISAMQIAAQSEKNALEAQINALNSDKNILTVKLVALEQEKSGFESQLPTLEGKLLTLTTAVERAQADSAQRIEVLEQEKAALTAEKAAIEGAKRAIEAEKAALERAKAAQEQAFASIEEDKARQSERSTTMEQENYRLSRRVAALEQSELNARQAQAAAASEAESLRAQVAELERFSGEKNADVLRSMVLASFNYSNLYVENNLKTAQVITDATSRNIGRVSESASSLLEQLDTIGRDFTTTSDSIRRNLANFQRELDAIQTGMNKRLSQDKFSPLLQENEKLRERLETELLAELSTDEETPVRKSPQPQLDLSKPQPLPFAEDLPKDFHDYLDD